MKVKITVIAFLILQGCAQDLCDKGYKEYKPNGPNSQSVCIPEYLNSKQLNNPKLGNTFYHKEYGMIIFKDGEWHDENNQIITNLK